MPPTTYKMVSRYQITKETQSPARRSVSSSQVSYKTLTVAKQNKSEEDTGLSKKALQ